MEQYNRMIVDGTPVFAGVGAVALAIPAPEVALRECADGAADTAASPAQSSAQTSVMPNSTVTPAAAEASAGEQLEGLENRPVYRVVKRAFDIVFSALVLVLFCWLYLIIAIAVKVDDPHGPVFFKQTRVTKGGREFTMYKFRSMVVDAESHLEELQRTNEKTGPVFKMRNDPRVTRVGRVLRKVSFDELPQFFNVLKGDLSVVGPRPALPTEVAQYNDYQRQRLLVKAGLTCYWQTRRNRDQITFDEWIDLDLLYIKKCNPWVDLKLIVQTVGVILSAQGE